MTTQEEFQRVVVQKLTYLETEMRILVGNGQPGRIAAIEQDVENLRIQGATRKGAMYTVNAIITIIVAGLTAWFGRGHLK